MEGIDVFVAGSRQPAAIPEKNRSAIANTIGKALTLFSLARIEELNKDVESRGGEPAFIDDEKKKYQTLKNIISQNPEKGLSSPVVVSVEIKNILTSMFISISDLINANAKSTPQNLIMDLMEIKCKESNILKIMCAANRDELRYCICRGELSRDFNFIEFFTLKLKDTISNVNYIDPGGADIAKIFVNFLKYIALCAANRAHSYGCSVTINSKLLIDVILNLEPFIHCTQIIIDASDYIRVKLTEWELLNFEKKKKQKDTPIED